MVGPLPVASLQPPARGHRIEFRPDAPNPLLNHPAVGFDLGLARPAQEPVAAPLALQMGPASDKPAFLIRQMGEFDLQPPLPCVGPRSENLKNEPGPVDHLAVETAFEIALLGRREFGVEDRHIHARRSDQSGEFIDLAGTEIGRRAQSSDGGDHGFADIEIDRPGQADGLCEPVFRGTFLVPAAGRHNDQRPVRQVRRREAPMPYAVPSACFGQSVSWRLAPSCSSAS